MTEYEVKCNQSWAWYTGFVHDFDESKGFFVVYSDDWKEPEWVEGGNIRPLPEPLDAKKWIPKKDEEVECQAKAGGVEPFGWWGCKIKNVQNNLFLVSFNGWNDQHNEVLDKSLLRPKNPNKPLSIRQMKKVAIQVPNELVDWVKKNPSEIRELKNTPKLVHLHFDPVSKQLVLIAPEKVIERVTKLLDLHFEQQRELYDFKTKAQDAEQKLEEEKEKQKNAVNKEFVFHPLLTGYILGPKAANLKNVRLNKEYGEIYAINLKHSACAISGSTEEVVDRAINELHIVAKKVILSSADLPFIIGTKGDNIRSLQTRSEVMRIISWEKFPEEFEKLKSRANPENRNQQNQNQNQNQNQKSRRQDKDIENHTKEFEEQLENLKEDDLFIAENDVVNLAEANAPDDDTDALVIIGKQSKVALAISMIELTLTHLRKQRERRNRIRALRQSIFEIKGIKLKPKNPKHARNENEGQETKGKEKGKNKNKNKNKGKDKKGQKEEKGAEGQEEQEEEQQQEEEEEEEEQQQVTKAKKNKKSKNKKNTTQDKSNEEAQENAEEDNDAGEMNGSSANKKRKRKRRTVKKKSSNEEE